MRPLKAASLWLFNKMNFLGTLFEGTPISNHYKIRP